MKYFDKENIIVIGIALALLIAWGMWYPRHQAKTVAQSQERRAEARALEAKNAAADNYAAKQAAAKETKSEKPARPQPAPEKKTVSIPKFKPVILSNSVASFQIDPNSGTVDRIELKQYDSSDRKSRIVYNSDLVPRKTFALEGLEQWQTTELSVVRPKDDSNAVSITRRLRSGSDEILLSEFFSLRPDSYSLQVRATLLNSGKAEVILPLLRVWSAGVPPMEQFAGDELNGRIMHRIEYCPVVGKQMVSLDPAMKEEKFVALELGQPTDWIGVTNKYFASLLFAKPYFDSGVNVIRTQYPVPGKKAGTFYYVPSIAGNYRNMVLKPGEAKEFEFDYFAGPKTLAEVKKLPQSAMPILHISSFSWMEYLARPVLALLNYLKTLCGNYGLAIILLTLIVRIVFFPLTERGNRSMRKMSKIAPQAKEIREKYKDNPQLMNQKTMELYRKEGVSPLGGCLPILLQIPVFFALYAALDSAVELRHVSFLWMTDLTKPDLVGPKFFFGYGIHPLVIMMTLLMVLQQKMTPSNMDPAQQKMMLAMPVIMLLFLYNLPSGLTLYWTVSQIFSIAQMKYSLYIAKKDEDKNDPALKSKSA